MCRERICRCSSRISSTHFKTIPREVDNDKSKKYGTDSFVTLDKSSGAPASGNKNSKESIEQNIGIRLHALIYPLKMPFLNFAPPCPILAPASLLRYKWKMEHIPSKVVPSALVQRRGMKSHRKLEGVSRSPL